MIARIENIECIDDVMAEIMRQKTPDERIAIANDMWKMARDMIRAVVAREHPDWTLEQIQRETATRLSHGAVCPLETAVPSCEEITMITSQQLARDAFAEPFRPFRISMASGQVFEIRHPETISVGRSTARIYTHLSEDPELAK